MWSIVAVPWVASIVGTWGIYRGGHTAQYPPWLGAMDRPCGMLPKDASSLVGELEPQSL